jgi:hypothetical protein
MLIYEGVNRGPWKRVGPRFTDETPRDAGDPLNPAAGETLPAPRRKSFGGSRNARRKAGCSWADQIKNMKTKNLLLSVLLSAGLVASAFAGRGNPQGGNGRGPSGDAPRGDCNNPECVMYPECPGPQQNPDCPGPQRKRDGSGGPNKPANPDCPQDGSGCPWNG